MGSNSMLAQMIAVEKDETAERPSGFAAKFKKTPVVSKLSRDKIDQLIVEHREHGKRLAWSFLCSWRIRMNQDEVMSIVGVALCEAANRFDADKGVAFKTFFFYHLRGMLLKEIARAIQEQRVLQYVPHSIVSDCTNTEHVVFAKDLFSLVENNNPERLMQKREVSSACWSACAQLDELEQEVLIRYFVYDEPLIKIASDLNYCRCHISRVKSRALARLSKLLQQSELTQHMGEQLEALGRKESAKRGAARRYKNYTGGRGRRKQETNSAKAEVLQKYRPAAA